MFAIVNVQNILSFVLTFTLILLLNFKSSPLFIKYFRNLNLLTYNIFVLQMLIVLLDGSN